MRIPSIDSALCSADTLVAGGSPRERIVATGPIYSATTRRYKTEEALRWRRSYGAVI
jgi:hypothetical protein